MKLRWEAPVVDVLCGSSVMVLEVALELRSFSYLVSTKEFAPVDSGANLGRVTGCSKAGGGSKQFWWRLLMTAYSERSPSLEAALGSATRHES